MIYYREGKGENEQNRDREKVGPCSITIKSRLQISLYCFQFLLIFCRVCPSPCSHAASKAKSWRCPWRWPVAVGGRFRSLLRSALTVWVGLIYWIQNYLFCIRVFKFCSVVNFFAVRVTEIAMFLTFMCLYTHFYVLRAHGMSLTWTLLKFGLSDEALKKLIAPSFRARFVALSEWNRVRANAVLALT